MNWRQLFAHCSRCLFNQSFLFSIGTDLHQHALEASAKDLAVHGIASDASGEIATRKREGGSTRHNYFLVCSKNDYEITAMSCANVINFKNKCKTCRRRIMNLPLDVLV